MLIEDAAALARVGAYIHLNPVRAHVVGPSEVASFRWSSLFRFVGTEPRPPWLQDRAILHPLGCGDDSAGWRAYVSYLVEIAEDEEAQERMEFAQMSKGWAIGTAGWRRAMAKELGQRALAVGLSESELREHKELRWQTMLLRELARRRRRAEDVGDAPARARWKREVALVLREEGGAPFRWIAERLGMGSAAAARVAVHRFERECNM